jgi:hypothetical protein
MCMDKIFWKGKHRPATPALMVAIKFGGMTALADALGKRPSTVQRWMESGFIPPKYQAEIQSAAVRMAIDFDPTILIPAPASAEAA